MKRAFTLIELLVVIAIIAVLAAILFPVFAAAKKAAKATTSLSNVRQLSLAATIYSTDNDDVHMISGAYDTGSDPLKFGDGSTVAPWSWLIVPYVKTGSLYDDPGGTPTTSLYSLSELVSKIVVPQYGYNHTFLAPEFIGADDRYHQRGVPVSEPEHPAETVMLTSKFSYNDSPGLQVGNFFTFDWYGAPLWTTVEAPFCDSEVQLCASNWGHNDTLVNHPELEAITDPEAGAFSGGVSTRAGGAIVSFTDGHVKKLSLSALAVGTNWNPGIDASAVLNLDKSKYLWDRE